MVSHSKEFIISFVFAHTSPPRLSIQFTPNAVLVFQGSSPLRRVFLIWFHLSLWHDANSSESSKSSFSIHKNPSHISMSARVNKMSWGRRIRKRISVSHGCTNKIIVRECIYIQYGAFTGIWKTPWLEGGMGGWIARLLHTANVVQNE